MSDISLYSSDSEIRRVFPKISDVEIQINKKYFQEYDKNQDGILDSKEIEELLNSIGFNNSNHLSEKLLNELAKGEKGVNLKIFIENFFGQDIRKKKAAIEAAKNLTKMKNNPSVSGMFNETADKFPQRTAILFNGHSTSFKELEERANQMSHWALSIGLSANETVSINMENKPDYIVAWLGLSKMGASSALINYNLRGKSLFHSISISDCKVLVIGEEVESKIQEIERDLREKGIRIFCLGTSSKYNTINLDIQPKHRLPPPPVKMSDIWALIYTSGTTGLPKAAIIRNFRFWSSSNFFSSQFSITENDIIYNSLPLYHSAGGMIGVGMCFCKGATMVIRNKFSANSFWKEIRQYNCTVFQYIGELCRYLLVPQESPLDSQNKIRVAIGNGLRPEIWETFQKRFKIPEIGEFYASTEGNATLWLTVSGENGRGAIGHYGYLQRLDKQELKIVKFDVSTEKPIRDKNGFCIECEVGEVGELIGAIIPGSREFAGYYGNSDGTNKKILSDAFEKGDKYFRTGDLIKRDYQGFFYFLDRIGDTFRWKGENVSTNEVSEVIGTFPGVQEANVYGVSVPGYDGRAGMVALVVNSNFDINNLGKYLCDRLPSYSVPIFVRILPEMSITGTFKHQKVELREEGISEKVLETNKVYLLDQSSKEYLRLSAQKLKSIISSKAKL